MASLESIFKRLNERNHTLTSPRTPEYNCIAFAAGETHRWWWPIGAYWPDNLPRLESVDGFVLAFETLGYVVCESGNLESGFERSQFMKNQANLPTWRGNCHLENGSANVATWKILNMRRSNS